MKKITGKITDFKEVVKFKVVKDYFFTYKCYEKLLPLNVAVWRYPESFGDNEVARKLGASIINDTSFVVSHNKTSSTDVSQFFDLLRCEDVEQIVAHEIYIERDVMQKAIRQLSPKYQAVIFLKMYPEFVFNHDFCRFLNFPEGNYNKILDEIKQLEIRKTVNSKKSWYYRLKKTINKIVESLEILEKTNQPQEIKPEPLKKYIPSN